MQISHSEHIFEHKIEYKLYIDSNNNNNDSNSNSKGNTHPYILICILINILYSKSHIATYLRLFKINKACCYLCENYFLLLNKQ